MSSQRGAGRGGAAKHNNEALTGDTQQAATVATVFAQWAAL